MTDLGCRQTDHMGGHHAWSLSRHGSMFPAGEERETVRLEAKPEPGANVSALPVLIQLG
jgi:hypothetical protein